MDELKMQNGALILEGGSLRSLFTSGVLDVFMEHNLYFPDVTGVSAGSLTGVNYVSRQPGRSAKLNIDYVNDKRYLGVNNLILHHEIFNFDFLFNDLSHSILPMDFDTFYKSPQHFTAVATNLRTGEAEYFENSSCFGSYSRQQQYADALESREDERRAVPGRRLCHGDSVPKGHR